MVVLFWYTQIDVCVLEKSKKLSGKVSEGFFHIPPPPNRKTIPRFLCFITTDGWFVGSKSKNSVLEKVCLGHVLYLSIFFFSLLVALNSQD